MGVVLIVGRHEDPHTESVSNALAELDCEAVCFDTFRGDRIRLSISDELSSATLCFSSELHQVPAEEIAAVWLRQKPVVPMAWWSPLQHDAARFSQSEWRNVIQTLESFVPTPRWLNRPEAQRRANYKPGQLDLARRVGFRIPETEITNDPDVVVGLIEKCGKAIYKNFSGYIFSDQTGILTSVVTSDLLAQNRASVSRAPGIYQCFVEKEFETRVTSVGGRHFAARIETPNEGPASVDWRYAQFEDVFHPCILPSGVERNIESYLDSAGLVYGAFDFVVTPQGEWVFLECNPAGQFLWIEHAMDYPISQAIAEVLSVENGSDSPDVLDQVDGI